MSLENIPVFLVYENDVIHRDGQDWLVITYKDNNDDWRVTELYVECVTGNVGEKKWWFFDDPCEVVQVYERSFV